MKAAHILYIKIVRGKKQTRQQFFQRIEHGKFETRNKITEKQYINAN